MTENPPKRAIYIGKYWHVNQFADDMKNRGYTALRFQGSEHRHIEDDGGNVRRIGKGEVAVVIQEQERYLNMLNLPTNISTMGRGNSKECAGVRALNQEVSRRVGASQYPPLVGDFWGVNELADDKREHGYVIHRF